MDKYPGIKRVKPDLKQRQTISVVKRGKKGGAFFVFSVVFLVASVVFAVYSVLDSRSLLSFELNRIVTALELIK